MRSFIAVTAALTVSMLFAIPAYAGSIDVVGHNIEVQEPGETFELANGQTFSSLRSRVVHLGISEGNPFDKAISTCSASCTMDADGSAGMCFGFCSGYDVDGDVFNFTWDGFADGTWTLVGGSGKWEGATGGGKWYPGTIASSGFANPDWDGKITMK